MVSCIDTFHIDLIYVAKFTWPKAWQLLGWTMGLVFEAMAAPRAEVARMTRGQDLHSKTSLVWTVLRIHRAMQHFIEVKFQGHPTIFKEMTLFMLTERMDPSKLGKLSERIRDANTKATVAQKAALMLEREVITLKRNYDNILNKVK
jgi:hypothetical protein